MTGHTVSPRCFPATISATRAATRSSMTAKTSSTVRPEAAMRSRSAALICRIAAFRSDGVDSQCGSTGRVATVEVIPTPLVRILTRRDGNPLRDFRQDSLLDCCRGCRQAVAGPAPLADRRARPTCAHGVPATDPGRARHPDGDLQADDLGERAPA